MAKVDPELANMMAQEAADRFWDRVQGSYQGRRGRGRAVVNTVVRDEAGRATGVLASVDGSIDQPLMIDHGAQITAGDVFIVENDGTPSLPLWRTIRRVSSAAAVPSAGELVPLPTPGGLTLLPGVSIGAPGTPVSAWIFATWDVIDVALYGENMDYELQYATNESIHQPATVRVIWTSPVAMLAQDISATTTIIPRLPAGAGYWYRDDFPFMGTIRIAAEEIYYTACTAGSGTTGTGVAGTNKLTDSSAAWATDQWENYALIDAAGKGFKITANDATVLYFTGAAASGEYTILPAFTGCVRGSEGTSAAAHTHGDGIICESIGTTIGGLLAGFDYNVRIRAVRFDGGYSTWSAWQTVSTPLDSVAPPTPTDFAVESTLDGVHLTWSGPTLLSCPDLAGFYIWASTNDQGANESLYAIIDPRTEAMVYTDLASVEFYYCIQAVDTSGNTSARTERLAGIRQPVGGANLIPNSDFTVANPAGTLPVYWDKTVYGGNTEVTYGDYGMEGGKGFRVSVPKNNPEGFGYGYLLCPVPLADWKIRVEQGRPYTTSFHFKIQGAYNDTIVYDSQEYTGSVKGLISALVYFHDGNNIGPSAGAFIREPKTISQTGDGWYRLEFVNTATEAVFVQFPTYVYLYLLILVQSRSTAYNLVVDVDRVQVEVAGQASSWGLTGVNPYGEGIRYDPSGMVAENLYVMADGTFASNLVPSADYAYTVGTSDRRWDKVYADTIVANTIETMTGEYHPPVSLGSGVDAFMTIGGPQELTLDTKTGNLVFASPHGTSGIPSFRALVAGDLPAHASTHQPSGADPLPTGAPSANLSVTSTNSTGTSVNFSRADHWHAITASSSPGAATALLKTDSAGSLTLDSGVLAVNATTNRVGINVASPVYPLDVVGNMQLDGDIRFVGAQNILTTSGNLNLAPAGDLTLGPGGDDVFLTSPVYIGTDNFVSGMGGSGWRVGYDGHADFRYIYAEELAVDTFTALVSQAHNGSLILTKDVAEVSRDFTVPAVSSSANLYVWDLPGMEDTQIFTSGDWVRLRYIDRSGGGLVVGDSWGQVYSYADQATGEQRWSYTNRSGGVGQKIYAGTQALGYGTSGAGIWQATVIHDYSPFVRVQTWSGSNPYSGTFTTHAQWGNLNGIANMTGYGIYAGQNTTTRYIAMGDSMFEVHGIKSTWYDASGNARVWIDPSATGSSQTLFGAGPSQSDYKFDLRADGTLYLKDTAVVGDGVNFGLDYAVVHAPFDGPQPWCADSRGTLAGSEGQPYIRSGGVVCRPGKYGKAVQVAEATTNYCRNPIAGGTGQFTAMNGATVTRDDAYCYMSDPTQSTRYSFKLVTSADNHGVRLALDTLTNAIHWVTIRVKGSLPSNWDWSLNGSAWHTPTLLGSDWEWDVYGYEFSAAEANGQGYLYVYQSGAGSGAFWIDGIQVEAKTYPTPLAVGSMGNAESQTGIGHSWNGTAHASRSARLAGSLNYPYAQIPSVGTISMWLYSTGNVADNSNTHCLVDGGGTTVVRLEIDGSDYLKGYIGNATAKVSYKLTGTNFPACTWNHVAMTWDGSATKLYLNGTLVDSGGYSVPNPTGPGIDVGNLSGASQWPGLIDDLIISDRDFTATEINIIANSGSPVLYTGGFNLFLTSAGKGVVWGNALGVFAMDANATPSWALVNDNSVSWGGKSFDSGDVVLGDPGYTHLFWDQSNGALYFRNDSTINMRFTTDGDAILGDLTNANLIWDTSAGKLQIRDSTTVVMEFDASGNALLGDAAGANMYWNAGIGKLQFRDTTTTNVYIETDGTLRAGAGAVTLDTDGITIDAGPSSKFLRLIDSDLASHYGYIYGGKYSATTGTLGMGVDNTTGGYTGYAGVGASTAGVAYAKMGLVPAPTGWFHTFAISNSLSSLPNALEMSGVGIAHEYDGAASTWKVGFSSTYSTGDIEWTGYFGGDLRVMKGLSVGVNEDPAANRVLVDQGTEDGYILQFRSADVAHGATVIASTSAFGNFKKAEGAAGGLEIIGLKDADGLAGQALYLRAGLAENAATGITSGASAIVTVEAGQLSSTTWADVIANGNIFAIRARRGGAFENVIIVDEDGDLYYDGSASAFDAYDDALMVRDLAQVLSGSWEEAIRYNKDALRALGVISWGDDGKVFVSNKRFNMLLAGAIAQLSGRIDGLLSKLSE